MEVLLGHLDFREARAAFAVALRRCTASPGSHSEILDQMANADLATIFCCVLADPGAGEAPGRALRIS